MASSRPLVLFGTGEIAELARFYFEHDTSYRVVAFGVDDEFYKEATKDGLPIVRRSELVHRFPPADYAMHAALSYAKLNQNRQRAYEFLGAAGYELVSYVCSKSVTWPDLKHGANCFILENQTIQPTVEIGDNVMLWSGNHIGHASKIGSHTYLASHVVISGHCVIGQRCFLGVNCTLRDFITVGDDCFIAMTAAVTSNVPSGAVVLGEGGKILGPENPAGQRIKTRYFGSIA